MKTTDVTSADLAGSVLAVPPLARRADLALDPAANGALIRHLEDGGVRTLMYGGNANFYNLGVSDYAETLAMIEDAASAESWVIPSVGPSFGLAMDQVRILRERGYSTAMVLPRAAQVTPAGAEAGIARIAEAFGRPVIVYIKTEGYLAPEGLGRLVKSGAVAAVKYAVERRMPSPDDYLRALIDAAGTEVIVSGMGELPAIEHLRSFGLAAFTSGSVCVAPRLSMAILAACHRGDFAEAERLRALFLPLEGLRNGLSQIRVLHEAVRLAGIADTGPMLPMLSNIEPEHHDSIAKAARDLLAADADLAQAA